MRFVFPFYDSFQCVYIVQVAAAPVPYSTIQYKMLIKVNKILPTNSEKRLINKIKEKRERERVGEKKVQSNINGYIFSLLSFSFYIFGSEK